MHRYFASFAMESTVTNNIQPGVELAGISNTAFCEVTVENGATKSNKIHVTSVNIDAVHEIELAGCIEVEYANDEGDRTIPEYNTDANGSSNAPCVIEQMGSSIPYT